MIEYFEAFAEALPRILDGVLLTVQLTVGGALLALIIAVTLGLTARQHNKWIRGSARAVIEFFRGTSLLVQLFWFVYVMPQLGLSLSPFAAAVLALGLNYGAYAAEVVRGSINSVPSGQWEASTALSLSPMLRMRRVIFPQAWALMIPSLNNLLIHLLKGTAVASFITLHALTFHTDQLRLETSSFFAYTVGLIIYFLIALALTLMMNALEIRAKNRIGRGPSLRSVLRLSPSSKTVKEGVA